MSADLKRVSQGGASPITARRMTAAYLNLSPVGGGDVFRELLQDARWDAVREVFSWAIQGKFGHVIVPILEGKIEAIDTDLLECVGRRFFFLDEAAVLAREEVQRREAGQLPRATRSRSCSST